MLFYASRYDPIYAFQLPMIWTTIEASLMSLMFLSIERIMAVHYPFESKTIVTVKRTVIFLVFIWSFAITCGVFVFFYTVISQLAMTILFELCVVIFLLSQSYIILKMQQRKRRSVYCDHEVSMVTKKHLDQHNHRVNNHVTKVVLILIVVVVVTLLPYMVALQVYLLSAVQSRMPPRQVINFINYFYPIELLNFIVNPIIYAYRLERYRRAFFKAFSFLNCGPFVKQRTRLGSQSSGYDFREQKSQRMTIIVRK